MCPGGNRDLAVGAKDASGSYLVGFFRPSDTSWICESGQSTVSSCHSSCPHLPAPYLHLWANSPPPPQPHHPLSMEKQSKLSADKPLRIWLILLEMHAPSYVSKALFCMLQNSMSNVEWSTETIPKISSHKTKVGISCLKCIGFWLTCKSKSFGCLQTIWNCWLPYLEMGENYNNKIKNTCTYYLFIGLIPRLSAP